MRINFLRICRRTHLCWILVMLSGVTAFTTLRAAPVVSNDDGYFFDDYLDSSGIFSVSQVRIASPGTVSLLPSNTSGDYRTIEIVPTSFDQWRQLTLSGTFAALGDLMVEVRSQDGVSVLIPAQPVNGPISLASLNSPLVPGIRVQVYFNQSATVAPAVDSLRVTWN